MTPDVLAVRLCAALQPSGRILEPCAGNGAFVAALRPYATTMSTCEIVAGEPGFSWWSTPVDWVVTNPPWSQFRVFLTHAMEVSDHVAMLVTVNHWWTRHRVRLVRRAGFGYRRLVLCDWPDTWPASGFQLGMMHVQRGYVGALEIQQLN